MPSVESMLARQDAAGGGMEDNRLQETGDRLPKDLLLADGANRLELQRAAVEFG